MNSVKKASHFFDIANIVTGGIAAAILVWLALAISVDVLLRYSLNISFSWLFEISEFSMVWITFLGAAWLLQRNGHINMDLILHRLNPRSKAMTNMVTSTVCAILFGVLCVYAIMVTLKDYQTNFIMGTVMEPPKWPIEIIIPVGCFLLFIQLLRKANAYLLNWYELSGERRKIK